MIEAIIRGMLGSFGSSILDFYSENALWINAILLTFALALIIARRGYKSIVTAVKLAVVRQYGEDIGKKDLNWFKKTFEKSDLDWEAIAGQTWMPIISADKSLWFMLKSPENLKDHFSPEKMHELFQEPPQVNGYKM